jgi:hypothetical protein
MSTGNYDLQIKWPSGHHSSAGTITDEQWAAVARTLSPDWRAPDHSVQNLNMVEPPSAAQSAPAGEREVVEVVGYRVSMPGEPELGAWLDEEAESEPQIQAHEPLMTVAQHNRILAAWQRTQSATSDSHDFKNFHRLLCERFGYTHDEKDWRRDQLSLIEHIAKQSAGVQGLRILFDGPPGPESGRFVEVEDSTGRSVNAGEWHERDDGLWELVIEQSAGVPEGWRLVPVDPTPEMIAALGFNGDVDLAIGHAAISMDVANLYRAAIAAAPDQPAAQETCQTCNGVGIVGHSELCPECRGQSEPAAQGQFNRAHIMDALLMWNRRHEEPPIKVGYEYGVAGAVLDLAAAQDQGEAVECMLFEYRHPDSDEKRTVAITRKDVADGMEDKLFEELCGQICRCESVGETNIVECNCSDYADEFQLLVAAPAQPAARDQGEAQRLRGQDGQDGHGNIVLTPQAVDVLAQCVAAHSYVLGALANGRPDLALIEAKKWVDGFRDAASTGLDQGERT